MVPPIFARTKTFLTVLCGCLLYAGIAAADSVTYQGAIYSLFYSGTPIADPATDSNPAAHETYRITLTIDTTGYTGGGSYITGAGLKVSSTTDFITSSLVSAPGSLTDWNRANGGVDGGGNCTATANGYGCAGWIGSGWGVPLNSGHFYVFTFDETVKNGQLYTATKLPHIHVAYLDANGNHDINTFVSLDIPLGIGSLPPPNDPPTNPVPEPSTFILLGAGLAVLGTLLRSRLIRN